MCRVIAKYLDRTFLHDFPWERQRLAGFGSGQDGRAPRLQVTRAPWHQHDVRVLSAGSYET
jgi:hypothetical protein